jgi:hypothetical protein
VLAAAGVGRQAPYLHLPAKLVLAVVARLALLNIS